MATLFVNKQSFEVVRVVAAVDGRDPMVGLVLRESALLHAFTAALTSAVEEARGDGFLELVVHPAVIQFCEYEDCEETVTGGARLCPDHGGENNGNPEG